MSTNHDSNHKRSVTHDNFFSSAMSDLRVAKEIFQQHFPIDLLSALDLNGIEICKDKFHSVNLKSKITDMLYTVPLKQSPQPAYIAALVEHRSTPQEHMPLRVLCYEAAIMRRHWNQHKVTPLVYTIVYYNGRSRWNFTRDLKDLIQAPPDLVSRYALQPFQLIELNQIADQELRGSLWAGVMSLAMKHVYDRDVLPALRSFIDMLKTVERQHGGDDFVLSLLYYLSERGDIRDENQFHDLIRTELPTNVGEKTMTLAERQRRKGAHNQSLAIAQNLLRKGLNPALVAETTGVDPQTVNKMAADTQNEKV